MTEVFILITAIIFFFIGKYSQTKQIEQTVTKIIKSHNRPKAGAINYPTPEELEYKGSEQEKIDAEWKKGMEGVKP